jgi:hypothetical protein
MQDAGCSLAVTCQSTGKQTDRGRWKAIRDRRRVPLSLSLSLSALRFAAPPFLPMEAMDAWNARRATMQSIIIIMVLLLLLLLEGASL